MDERSLQEVSTALRARWVRKYRRPNTLDDLSGFQALLAENLLDFETLLSNTRPSFFPRRCPLNSKPSTHRSKSSLHPTRGRASWLDTTTRSWKRSKRAWSEEGTELGHPDNQRRQDGADVVSHLLKRFDFSFRHRLSPFGCKGKTR